MVKVNNKDTRTTPLEHTYGTHLFMGKNFLISSKQIWMIKEVSCNAQVYERNINHLRANPTKWSNTLKQFVGKLPTNCLVVFDHFVGLALKGLNDAFFEPYQISLIKHKNAPSQLFDRVLNTLESAAKAGIAKTESSSCNGEQASHHFIENREKSEDLGNALDTFNVLFLYRMERS